MKANVSGKLDFRYHYSLRFSRFDLFFPRNLPTAPDEDDMFNAPLPSIPPSYEDAVTPDRSTYENDSTAKRRERASSAGGESGIDVGDRDEAMTPLLQGPERDGGKPVAIEMTGKPGHKLAKRKSVETIV